MIREHITVDQTLALLNELLALDPSVAHALVERRWACNKAVADHPTIQVTQDQYGTHVGLLGILNGIFGADEEGWGPICAVFDEGRIQRFERTSRTIPKNPVIRMTSPDLQEHLEEFEALTADGFEAALVGFVTRFGFPSPVALYDQDECIRILMNRDGMGADEAVEFFEFNVFGAWVGDGTPAFTRLLTPA